jgi:hypothetical protein
VMVDFKSYLEKLSIKEAAMSFKNSASIRWVESRWHQEFYEVKRETGSPARRRKLNCTIIDKWRLGAVYPEWAKFVVWLESLSKE